METILGSGVVGSEVCGRLVGARTARARQANVGASAEGLCGPSQPPSVGLALRATGRLASLPPVSHG